MRRRCIHFRTAVILSSTLLILVGCAKRRTGTAGEAGPGSTGRVEEERIGKRPSIREAPVTPTPAEKESPLKDVYFDFDRAVLREDAEQALRANIQWLKANPRTRIQVEGHSDERGTNEYNLALGDLRAKTVRDYLVAGGVAAQRITIISYGEERPFVVGSNEEAWQWNRRGHFVVISR
jgi:peptidoglycan-associated lipoprotein